jgi:lipopolysaccharide transport system permease protein
MLSLYLFIFGYIFGGRLNAEHPETPVEYALALFLGLSVFQLFSDVFGTAPFIVISNPNYVKKVVFPLEILPIAAVGSSLIHGAVNLVLVTIGIALFGPGLTAAALWVPVALVFLVLFLLGVSWLVSAIGVFFRDIGQILNFTTTAVLFSSAVFYPASIIPAPVWSFLRFNPLLLIVQLTRDAVMWHRPVHMHHIAYIALVSVGMCCFGYWLFRKTAPAFADVI